MSTVETVVRISREQRREARRHLHDCNFCPETYTCFDVCGVPESRDDEDYVCPECWERIQTGEELERR
jgi:hypothetical protein